MTDLLVEPSEPVSFRGNVGFSGGGTVGRTMMPPWPSTLAGALRSRALVAHGVLEALVAGGELPEGPVRRALGPKPAEAKGPFRLVRQGLWCDRRQQALFPVPADLVVTVDEQGAPSPARLEPAVLGEGVAHGGPLPMVAALRAQGRSKPSRGWWLTAEGLGRHLQGQAVTREDLVHARTLWCREVRVGVALDAATRSAEEGRLFTTEYVRLHDGVALYVRTEGDEGIFARPGWLRLGGDGRLARVGTVEGAVHDPGLPPSPDAGPMDGFRIVLATPGLFRGGWVPDRVRRDGDRLVLEVGALRAELVCAAVPRAEAISGWDMARRRPWPVLRAAPAGSTYWFRVEQGGVEELAAMVEDGWWGADDEGRIEGWRQRRAQGFNNFWIGRWSGQEAS